MENHFVKKSSLRYPKERHVSSNKLRVKLKTNLFGRHGIEPKLKESFLKPLKLPFEGTLLCKFSARKVSTCDKCIQTDHLETPNLENVVSKTADEEKLNVNIQLISISLASASGSKTIICTYQSFNTKSHFDNILNKIENYMEFESVWCENKKPHQVINYEFKIRNDCKSLLTYMRNIDQSCVKSQNENRFLDNPELYPVIRNSSPKELKCKIPITEKFETYRKIVEDKPSKKVKIIQKWIPQNVNGKLRIGIDRNLSLRYLPNNDKKLYLRDCPHINDPGVSNLAKTMLCCLVNTKLKKRNVNTKKAEYKMITGASENETNNEIDNLKTKIEEIKQQLPLNSPIDALLEMCGPKSHIADMILNKKHHKKVVYNKSDSRFRTIRKTSNTDELSQTNSNSDDECLKLNFRNIGTPGSSKQSRRSNSRPNSPYFEIDNFYVCNNSLDYLQNELHMSLKSNVNMIETLYNLQDNVINMENNLILFHQYICSIKSEIGHLIFKHTCKQKNITELLKHIESESKKRNLSSTQYNEFYEKYCELESLSSKERSKAKALDSTEIYFPFKFQVALSVIFLIGFLCGDFVK